MRPFVELLVTALILSITAFAFFELRFRRRRGHFWLPRRSDGLRLGLEIGPKDGWTLLNLVVTNRTGRKVWVEEATVLLSDIDADFQASAPTARGAVKVREALESGETLRISLVEAVYGAAGRPQGTYIFLISGITPFRMGGEWREARLPTYEVAMVALCARRVRRLRSGVEFISSVGSTMSEQGLLKG